MSTKTKNSLSNEAIRDLLNNSANKTNNNLIFFFSFGLYVFISVINTSDIALLLPKHSFKMPFIDFELGLLHFYVLAPLLLLLLHFNLLFNHYKNLEKLDEYKNRIDLNTINPSLYGFAFIKGTRGWEGFMINSMLYLLLYILPIIIFVTIYIRFADYHHFWITPVHLIILIIDLVLILSSILYNHKHFNFSHKIYRLVDIGLSFIFFIGIGAMMIEYYRSYYYPTVYANYDQRYENTSKDKYSCRLINKLSNYTEDIVCYPRLIVTEEEMAIISKSALYIPRYLTMKNIDEKDKEHDLIINHGTRIDLSNRNLRYAILKGNILTRANLKNTELQASNLTHAHMQAVDLENADLTEAELVNVQFEYAYLGGANLQGANLTGAQMQNINTFTKENKKVSDFQNTNMQNVNLYNAKLEYTNFKDADLRKANLTKTNLTSAQLKGTSFSEAIITDTLLKDANLTNADFSKTKYYIYECTTLDGEINKSECGAPTITGATMTNANLFGSNAKFLRDELLLDDDQNKSIRGVLDINLSKSQSSAINCVDILKKDEKARKFFQRRNIYLDKNITENREKYKCKIFQ
ncbi:MAG: hypothetical protein COB07_05505 [Sulfurovum sp.]|nr:MAG: hypothetical protein COB07_05505 [Sulfurovum sp.]